MSVHETYSLTATLIPGAGTATLLRLVSILHSRGVQVSELEFTTGGTAGGTLTVQVTSGNAPRETVEASWQQAVETLRVVSHVQQPLDLVRRSC